MRETDADVEREIEQAVYDATVKIFERMELEKRMDGNGHHAAQKAAAMVKEMLQKRWRKVYVVRRGVDQLWSVD